MEEKLEVVMMPLDSVVPYDNNPRMNDDAVEKVADSIRSYGWRQPIVVDKDNVVICGHTRRLAAIRLGLKKVPVHVAWELTPEQVRAYRLDDNKTAEYSAWDFARLKDEALALCESGYDMSTLAFGKEELDGLLGDGGDSVPAEQEGGGEGGGEEEPEGYDEPEETADDPDAVYDSAEGGVYQLGRHRLVCGDCTESLDIARLFDGDGAEPVSLWLTDPPYNVNYVGRAGMNRVRNNISPACRNKSMTLANDNLSAGEFESFITKAFSNCAAYMNPGASLYVFHAHTIARVFEDALKAAGMSLSMPLIWAKNNFALSWGNYFPQHEPIFFGWKDGAAHRWYGPHDGTTTTLQKWKIITKCDLHPSMKPLPMLEFFVKNSSAEGEIVMDTFGGSGSTLIACENTGRVCRMMEKMPKYADVIRKRWAEHVHGEGCDWKALAPKVGTIA